MQRGRLIAVTVLAAFGLTACTGGHATRTSSSAAPSPPMSGHTTSSASRPGSHTGPGRPSHAAPPDRITTGPTLAGCPLFPPTNPWRRDISHDPLSRYSAAWVASVGTTGFLHPDFGSNPSYGFPYSVVPAGQPKVPVRFTAYGSDSDTGPYPIPSAARIEAGSDHHVLVASGDCHLYELFGAARSGSGWSAASGAMFNLRSNALRPAGWTSADAAGLPILPGLVRREEVETGHIAHALRFTVAQTERGYISPATHQAGSTSSMNVPPMGARFRLKASFSLSRFHGAARVILQCLKTYGMIVADNGANWFVSGATDVHWNDTDLDQLKTVPGSAFEVVDSGLVHH
ncbi:MAG TPA: hypothetical protein VHI14_00510 [Jatrophihabitantaceae bacterium]|nr:hypothetical protein [Jatrophihabitantaceae bacterium]